MIITFYTELAAGRWFKISLMEQLGNIGSEVGRAAQWQEKDPKIFNNAVERALELFDLTLNDERWRGRRSEIARARELLCDAAYGNNTYNTSIKDLDRYFFLFAYAARRHSSSLPPPFFAHES